MTELVSIFKLLTQSLVSPVILFFLSGIFIGLLKTDLQIPQPISKFLSLYLMIAIGFKGGVSLALTPELTFKIFLLFIVSILISFFLPFISYFFLRTTTKLDLPTAAALAAHYGSVSIVTFMTAESFLKNKNIYYSGYLIAILALMEAPAILSGIYLSKYKKNNIDESTFNFLEILRSNGCLVLLIASFIIGLISGQTGYDKLKGFFDSPFQGILAVFLLDMGLLVAEQFKYVKQFTLNLFLFGLYMPIVGSLIGLLVSYIFGLDIGSATLFMVLCASASYIAVPAAMRIALPEAQVAIYLPMSLVVTFPFNVIVGISLYYSIAKFFLG
ncbi:MAG: sodium-dependent bicarbonate transport family permease [Candidatus Babeliales bacterium]|nr:sodium-dependent bicarbonate transport family permease [Candidatus Babeliales bacterium]